MTETELRTDGDTRCAETHEPMTWNEAAGAYTHAGKCVFGREHRHLELTIHPPAQMPGLGARRWEMDAYWAVEEAQRVARSVKRLRDLELAAEYWAARWDYDSEHTGGGWHHHGQDLVLEDEVMLRFATLPHAASSNYE